MNNHEQINNKLQYFINTKKIPNIIFHGASQSGKRTLLNQFLQNIYQGDRNNMKTHIMTVECCHGKGIKFIREELKFFAKAHIQSNHGANFKSIVLLNADFLTIDAQSALRRCIELFSHNTRFFIVVENKERLLNPILSRFCEIFVYATSPKLLNQGDQDSSDSEPSGYEMYQDIKHIHITLPETVIESAIRWCEHGFTAGDWVSCLKYDAEMDQARTIWVQMYYYKIKPDFRCEKILVFYLLYFTFVSSKEDLVNMTL
jgi:hypothetical protein